MNDDFNPDEIMLQLHNSNDELLEENILKTKAKKTEAEKKDHILPDGVGLSFEELKNIIAIQHGVVFSNDDPVLIFVSVLNAFLAEEEKLLFNHNTALKKIMAASSEYHVEAIKTATKSYLEESKKITDNFGETLKSSSVEAINNVFKEHSSDLTKNNSNIKWASIVISVATIINLVLYLIR